MTVNKDTGKTRTALLSRARELATVDSSFATFLRLTVESIDERDLAGFSAEDYESVLKHSYERLGQHKAGSHLINIWMADGDEDVDPVTIIDIYVDDMPFLVDSVLNAVRAHGGHIRLMAHPILRLEASKSGVNVLAEGGSRSESFLQIHIDPIHDEHRLTALFNEIDGVLNEVRATVRGWRPMLERLHRLVQEFRNHPPRIAAPVLAETLHFLAWLADHNFTFLGMREYRLKADGDMHHLEPVVESGLGILEDPAYHFMRHGTDYVEMTEQHIAFLKAPDPLMVTKANLRARVHRRGHMDYIGVKLYDDNGELAGELRILGLFTSMSLATPHTDVPFIRRKISEVMARSGFDPKSHAGKALMAALDNYPREELFQISIDQLAEFAGTIATLPDRPRIRVFPRIDTYDNFVSILLFMPRERYSSQIRERIGEHLAAVYEGRVSAYYPHFPEGDLVRVHFIIGRNGGKTPNPDRTELEAEIRGLTESFGDRLLEAAEDPAAIEDYRDAFSAAYQAQNTHTDAIIDIAAFKALDADNPIGVRLVRPDDAEADHHYTLKVYHVGGAIPLSDRVPMLENFGFRVIDERTYEVTPLDAEARHLHDMLIEPRDTTQTGLATIAPVMEQAMLAVWDLQAESDPLNQLSVSAALNWDDVVILRALSRYLKQIGIAFSQHYIASALDTHADIAAHLVNLFHTLHQPDFSGDRDAEADQIREAIIEGLDAVSSADEDFIIRQILNLIECALRTNFYQRGADGNRRPALAIKFDSARIEGLPEPRPYREIFVYSPQVEGVHLRGGSIARGGLRWSDRPEDFRTEVLGLVKAQMVKNAVIVPVGAKGGFVPKLMPANPDRETFLSIGTACYKIYIGALLDITDNLDGDTVVPPTDVTRRDGDDPYLVVAADKGTATFSDTANAISESRNYWLGDAFASGGSAGYDHKKMGITARGGWEAVKRHFREMDHDIQKEPFTAVGVGDMSGDVFGNGMLLSRHTRLIAAFDHRDIFIDPDPDPQSSYKERKRLFEMGRSSWQDYDTTLLSRGGGIYSRNAKTIDLSVTARKLLDLGEGSLTPREVMNAILKADADLLWFGGIGTYIRASSESDADAGDRANDAIRITGKQVRAKVIGEGANLGVTQLGRIEYALAGGRVNSDAIDNSAGVNSSDLEVNIKIALGTLVRAGKMDIEARNDLLVEMTEEVAALCLRNNYLQTLALSLAERRGMDDFPDLVGFMQALEQKGVLSRQVEYLPDDTALADRVAANQPLTRPELAVLLAYAKNTLYADLLTSDVPDDPYLSRELFRYFPDKLRELHPQTIETHRLRREVIATVLSNAMINRGGPAFVHRMTTVTSADPGRVACAYAAARDAYGLAALNAEIDAIDNKVSGKTQLELYAEVQTLQIDQTLWFLRNVDFSAGLSGIIDRYSAGIAEVREVLSGLLPQYVAQSVADQAVGFVNGGASRTLARQVAELSALTLASDIVYVSEQTKASVAEATEAYFAVLETFKLGRITEHGSHLSLSDRYDRMALDRALANLMRAQRNLTGNVLGAGKGDISSRIAVWRDIKGAEADRIIHTVNELTEGDLTVSRLSVAAGLLADLVRT